MKARWISLLLAGAVVVGATGCGKRGNPLAPIRPVSGPVTALTARRVSDQIELRFVIPVENANHTTPPAIDHVDIYGSAGPPTVTPPVPMTIPSVMLEMPDGTFLPLPPAAPAAPAAGAPAAPPVGAAPVGPAPLSIARFPPVTLFPSPTAKRPAKGAAVAALTTVALMTPKHLRGHIAVVPPDDPLHPAKTKEPVKPADPADTRPTIGSTATFVAQISKERAAAQSVDLSVLRYVVVSALGRHRVGTPSAILEIPLTTEPVPMGAGAVTYAYDETTVTLAWTASAPTQTFRVYRSDAAGKEDGAPLNAAPLAVATFTLPVEFGVERCFVVRSVVMKGAAVSVESQATPPVCKTAVDTFPPPVPAGLATLPTDGKIRLEWNAVSATDLAGYLVLRAVGAATPEPLMAVPITDTDYTDTTTTAGVLYTYAVVAVDKAGNRSAPSDAVPERAR